MFLFLIRHGILVAVMALMLVILGSTAVLNAPVQMVPDIEVRTISIETNWRGATPQDVEKDILIDQEQYLRNLPDLQKMTSIAESGSATIELEFPFDVDMTEKLVMVNGALSQISSYPANVDQPRVVSAAFSTEAFLRFHISPTEGNPQNIDIASMADYVEDRIRPSIESVQGVSEATVSGGTSRQLQLFVDQVALAQMGLSLTEVKEAINQRNIDISAGEMDSGKRRYLIRTLGRFKNIEELKQLILIRRGDDIIRLKDVADVQFGLAKKSSVSYFNGQQGIGLQVRRESGANVVQIKHDILAEMERLNRDVLAPDGLRMVITSDDVRYVQASIKNVLTNLGLGALFATFVLYLFLRSSKATFVAVIGIPLCTLAAFLGLMMTGRTINVISLAGVAFAIGMSVDNSIVVLENIERYRRYGLDRLESALKGVKDVWSAVLASTLSTVLVFLPILFINEEAGQIYSDVAIAVSGAILASMVVAVTVVPVLCANLNFSSTQPQKEVTRSKSTLEDFFLSFSNTPSRRFITIAATTSICITTLGWLIPPAEYLPEGEEPKTFARMSAPPGYSMQEMAAIGEQVKEHFLPHLDASREDYDAGRTAVPPLAYMTLSVSPSRIFSIVEPVDPADIDPLMDELTRFYETFPGMRAFAARGSIISSNNGGTRSINLDISGPDLSQIYTTANFLYQDLSDQLGNPRIQSNPSSLTMDQPMVQVYPNWDRLEELNMSMDTLGFTISSFSQGAFVDDFFLDDEKLDMYLYSSNRELSVADLSSLIVYTPAGGAIPLTDLVTIEETVDTSTVRRIDGRRTVTLNVIPPRDMPLESGVQAVESRLLELRQQGIIPPEITVNLSGASDQLDVTQAALSKNFIIALAIVYLLLVAILSNWIYPLLILTTIPVGISGGVLGLVGINYVGEWLPSLGLPALSQPFDMITMLGFLILMGTVINNPILIIESARQQLKERHCSIQEAVQSAVSSRLRPIAITTMSTIFGLMPLVLLPGEGSELYRGVGAVVLFGLFITAFVTVTFLPAITIWALEFSQRFRPTK